MAQVNILGEYLQLPPVTKVYTTACVITTLLVQFDFVSPLQLYFNPTLIINKFQIWRLVTAFLFFGTISFNFLFSIIFACRYCKMLEEGSFRNRTADFMMMMIFGGTLIILVAIYCSLLFLGQAFAIMLVYVWARRNPFSRMNFLGLLNFRAPYLPWVFLGIGILLDHNVMGDLVGICVGHIYYYIEDICPTTFGGVRLLKTPQFLKNIFEPRTDDTDYNAQPEVGPGGFRWGERQLEQQGQ